MHFLNIVFILLVSFQAIQVHAGVKDVVNDLQNGRINKAKAVAELEILANDGEVEAQHLLATINMGYFDQPKNEAVAAYWYQKAATKGHVDSQKEIADMYWLGKGVPQSNTLAASWFLKAAEGGNAFAQVTIGGFYANGTGVKINKSKAIHWYKKAIEAGDKSVAYQLAMLYKKEKDYKSALKWFRISVEDNYEDARYNLGEMYLNGHGVQKNIMIAYALYLTIGEISVTGGEMAPIKDNIARKLSKNELAIAKRLAKEMSSNNNSIKVLDDFLTNWMGAENIGKQ